MNRIRLQWQVESERIEQSDSEDPDAKRARRQTALRLAFLIALMLAIIASCVVFLRQRLLDVQGQLEQLLRDTVSAETAALRIGDVNTFMSIQESANLDWRHMQQRTFRHYADLKQRYSLELTGTILALEIEGARGRILLEEIINGQRYVQLWFYRSVDGQWRHAPPMDAFWGDPRVLEDEQLRITYHEVDESFALALHDAVGDWLERGCDILQCDSKPPLSITVVPQAAEPVSRLDEGDSHLRIRSPYSARVRMDMPFDRELQLSVAERLANHMVMLRTNGLSATYPQDGLYLRESLVAYMLEAFTGVDQGLSLVESLAENYGEESVAKLAYELGPGASLAVLARIIGEPLDSASLDWRDFVKWRLNTEAQLMSNESESAWLSLYDTADESVWRAAYQRYQSREQSRTLEVLNQAIKLTDDGRAQLQATARIETSAGTEYQTVLFNLVQGVWKRGN